MHRLLPEDRQQRAVSVRLPAGTAAVPATARWRLALLGGVAAAMIIAVVVGDPAPLLQADPELGRLLRSMAAIKFSLVAAALVILWWRMGKPLQGSLATGYLAATWALAGAATLIWQLSLLAPASIVFHTATLSLLVLSWRDSDRPGGMLFRLRKRPPAGDKEPQSSQ